MVTMLGDYWHRFLAIRDLPSWLQAGAAGVALFISLLSLWVSGRSERRRSQLEAHGLAVAIYPQLRRLQLTVADRVHDLQGRPDAPDPIRHLRLSIQASPLPLPPLIDRQIENLYKLGKKSGPLAIATVMTVDFYNAFSEPLVSKAFILDAEEVKEAALTLKGHLDLIHAAAAAAADRAERLADDTGFLLRLAARFKRPK